MEQLRPGSTFLEVLNHTQDVSKEERIFYKINDALQGSNGANRDIYHEIIAGEVIKEQQELIRRFGSRTSELIERGISSLKQLFSSMEGSDDFFDSLIEKEKDLGSKFSHWIGDARPGDYLVTVESAKIDGIPMTVVPFSHFQLLDIKDREDLRYTVISRFIKGLRK